MNKSKPSHSSSPTPSARSSLSLSNPSQTATHLSSSTAVALSRATALHPSVIHTLPQEELVHLSLVKREENLHLRHALQEEKEKGKMERARVIKEGKTPNDVVHYPSSNKNDQKEVNELLLAQRSKLEEKDKQLRKLREKMHESNVGFLPYKGRGLPVSGQKLRRPGSVLRSMRPRVPPVRLYSEEVSQEAVAQENEGRFESYQGQHDDESFNDNEQQKMSDEHDPDPQEENRARLELEALSSSLESRLISSPLRKSVPSSPFRSSSATLSRSMRDEEQKTDVSFSQMPSERLFSPPNPPDSASETLQEELKATQTRLAILASHFESLRTTFQAKVDFLSATVNELAATREENERLRAYSVKLESNQRIQDDNTPVLLASLKVQLENALAENTTLNERIKLLQQSLVEADKCEHQRQALIIHNYLTSQQTLEKEVKLLRDQLVKHGHDRDAAKRCAEDKSNLLHIANIELDKHRDAYAALEQQHHSLRQEHGALSNETQKWRNLALEAQSDLKQANDKIQISQQDLTAIQNHHRKTEDRAQQLQQQLDVTTKQHQQSLVTLNQMADGKSDALNTSTPSVAERISIEINISEAILTTDHFDSNSRTLVSCEWPDLKTEQSYSEIRSGLEPRYCLVQSFDTAIHTESLLVMRKSPGLLIRLYSADEIVNSCIGEGFLDVSSLFDGLGHVELEEDVHVIGQNNTILATIKTTTVMSRPIVHIPDTAAHVSLHINKQASTADDDEKINAYARLALSVARSQSAKRALPSKPPQTEHSHTDHVHPSNCIKQNIVELNMGADTPRKRNDEPTSATHISFSRPHSRQMSGVTASPHSNLVETQRRSISTLSLRIIIHACSVLALENVRLAALSVPYQVDAQFEYDEEQAFVLNIPFDLSLLDQTSLPHFPVLVYSSLHSMSEKAQFFLDLSQLLLHAAEDQEYQVPVQWMSLQHPSTKATIGSIQCSYSYTRHF